ncbi:AAA family ATPase [Vibrio fluvialis]|nr:AAA family ATPase [Vibrio fluvialis]
MSLLKTNLRNCYGIKKLVHEFDFSGSGTNTFAIYAPNGLMKTSFTKTFEEIAEEREPKEERFNRPSTFEISFDGKDIEKECIYVLKSEIDTNSDDESVSNLLINQESKLAYDLLIKSIDKIKTSMISKLQKASGIPKKDIETTLINDFESRSLIEALHEAKRSESKFNIDGVIYSEIFSSDAIKVLDSREFTLKAREFVERYDDVFKNSGGLYLKGVFNPTKANASVTSLEKNSFFEAGHKVKINGNESDLGLNELKEKIKEVNKKIDSDQQLNKLKTSLSKNAQTQALQSLLEKSSSSEVDTLITNLNKGKREWFKKELWRMYIQNCSEVEAYLTSWEDSKTEIEALEQQAETEAPQWNEAIELFNSRFVDMPFTLGLFNQSEAVLGKSKALLKFIFEDQGDTEEYTRSEIKDLSQGEKRALYLLNFIFDVEMLKKSGQKTLFIIDDVADSFDYKNKHAILQYLDDLTKTDHFFQIILTHNFDFYRSLTNFVSFKRLLMANKDKDSIKLEKAEGVKNIFINLWKAKVTESKSIMYSCVPFTRNLIEYTKGDSDDDYLTLTKLLHWKDGSENITEGNFYEIYNNVFGTNHDTSSKEKMLNILFNSADEISSSEIIDGLNLENKVLLSIAIRIKAEQYITNKLRVKKKVPEYWSTHKAYGKLLGQEFEKEFPEDKSIKLLRKVSVTVCSNIHLNSFMYEPILDLSLEHLSLLYKQVKALS